MLRCLFCLLCVKIHLGVFCRRTLNFHWSRGWKGFVPSIEHSRATKRLRIMIRNPCAVLPVSLPSALYSILSAVCTATLLAIIPHFLIFHRFFILCPVLTTQLLFFKACHDKAVLFFFFTFFNIFISYLLLETEWSMFHVLASFRRLGGSADSAMCILYSLFLKLQDRHWGIPCCASPSASCKLCHCGSDRRMNRKAHTTACKFERIARTCFLSFSFSPFFYSFSKVCCITAQRYSSLHIM